MICPKCSGETKVVNSRPHRDDRRVIVRRRACLACEYRFNTQEGTIDIVRRRETVRRAEKIRRQTNPASARAADAKRSKRRSLQKQAMVEAKETGRDIGDIFKAWGLQASAEPKTC